MQALGKVLFSKTNTLFVRQLNNTNMFAFAGKGKEGGAKPPAGDKPAAPKKEKVFLNKFFYEILFNFLIFVLFLTSFS